MGYMHIVFQSAVLFGTPWRLSRKTEKFCCLLFISPRLRSCSLTLFLRSLAVIAAWLSHTHSSRTPWRSASSFSTHISTRTHKQTHTFGFFLMSTTNIEKAFICKTLLLPPPLRSLNGAPQNTYRRERKSESEDRYPPPCRASTDPDLSCLLKSTA